MAPVLKARASAVPMALLKGASRQRSAPKVAMPQAAKEMMTWTPIKNKMFETFSFLPPLDDGEIARQVDYVIANGWTPCLEFAAPEDAYVKDKSQIRFGNAASCGYYDNRYWTMWKLPMFGCNDPEQVLDEMGACGDAFPNCYIRLVAFDSVTQTQMIGFLVQRPRNADEFRKVDQRSVN